MTSVNFDLITRGAFSMEAKRAHHLHFSLFPLLKNSIEY